VIVARGTPGSAVTLEVWDEAGSRVCDLPVNLDDRGLVTVRFYGRQEMARPLGYGLFWVRAASGSVNDRQRFMVVPKKAR
jgi:hypothetical protein